jgi:hypothetical protein
MLSGIEDFQTVVRRQNLNEIDSAFLRSHIFRGII